MKGEIVSRWIKKAGFDKISRVSARNTQTTAGVIYFHCQQAAEKYLKV